MLLLGRGRHQLPGLWAIWRVRVVLPRRPAKVPRVCRLRGWCWHGNRRRYVDGRGLHVGDRRRHINGLRRRGAWLAGRSAHDRPSEAQKQQRGNPIGRVVVVPLVLAAMRMVGVRSPGPIGNCATCHNERQQGDCKGLGGFFHGLQAWPLLLNGCHAWALTTAVEKPPVVQTSIWRSGDPTGPRHPWTAHVQNGPVPRKCLHGIPCRAG